MERFHGNISSSKAALQERPKILHAVSVYAAIHVFNSVVNNLVLIFVQAFVSVHLVGKERGSGLDVFSHDRLESFFPSIWNKLGANFSTAFQHSHNDEFVESSLTASGNLTSLDALVHVACLATDECLVRFDFATVAT